LNLLLEADSTDFLIKTHVLMRIRTRLLYTESVQYYYIFQIMKLLNITYKYQNTNFDSVHGWQCNFQVEMHKIEVTNPRIWNSG
jgi:hypothetical protein